MSPSRFAQTFLVVMISVVFVFPGTLVQAATWYVTPGGDDASDCQTTSTPCLTINGAIGKAGAGDTILVSEGTYTAPSGSEVVYLNKSVTLSGGWDAGFTAQGGMSIIDGGGARRGVFITGSGTGWPVVTIDHFTVRRGFDEMFGGGLFVVDVRSLTLDCCVVSNNVSLWMGGGIHAYQVFLTINNTTISGNTAGKEGYSGADGGGGIQIYYGDTVLNNSTVSGNRILGGYSGSGIRAIGDLTLNNSTVSGNSGGRYGEGISVQTGTVTLRNSTVSFNQRVGIITSPYNTLSLQNSVVAGNGVRDCMGAATSGGHNLIGNGEDCSITQGPGDQIGSSAAPIDPLLLPLQANGGPTFTHALRSDSPALNAGNPAEPGSGGNACLATDQRGQPRPDGSACDIGAFEGSFTVVEAIRRVGPNPTNAASVDFTVTFSGPVSGVDLTAPFGDFAITTTGVTTGAVTGVSGSGDTYTVTVALNTHSGNGTVRLDVADDDSIVDASANPLGGAGIGNGNYTAGQRYTVLTIPPPLAPTGKISTARPTYKWTKVPGATRYRYQLLKGSTVVYARIVSSAVCGSTACSNASTTALGMGSHRWRVQAMLGGAWKGYSPYKAFTVSPRAGLWSGYGVDFYVTSSLASVDNFAIIVGVTGCGTYRITHRPLVRITDSRFAFGGPFYASGTFSSPTTVSGAVGLDMLYIPGCGYVKGGPFSWSGAWRNPSQPRLADAEDSGPVSVAPMPEPSAGSFGVELAGP